LAGLFALTAGWMDWRSRRIPNWLTVSGLIVALTVNTIAGGWAGAKMALAGAGLGLLVLFTALLVAGLMALGLVIYRRRLGQTVRNIGCLLLAFATGRPGDPSISLDNPQAAKVPFGVAFAVAVILYVGRQLVFASFVTGI